MRQAVYTTSTLAVWIRRGSEYTPIILAGALPKRRSLIEITLSAFAQPTRYSSWADRCTGRRCIDQSDLNVYLATAIEIPGRYEFRQYTPPFTSTCALRSPGDLQDNPPSDFRTNASRCFDK